MILTAFTILHVLISLAAILAGFIFTAELLTRRTLSQWTGVFLVTTIATSITGFFFPAPHFMPSHGVGIVSLIVLSLAVFALYGKKMDGGWRKTFVITAVMGFYLNVFVGVVQAFGKFQPLKELAPMQTETPFILAQGGLLTLFIAIGAAAVFRFRQEDRSGEGLQ